ncbi:MAG: glutamate--tRNA ligase [Oscillospiraceae bacterium]
MRVKKVRTRFAPSPTGYMHVGNLRTALYAWLLARGEDRGSFILRIEDTDRERYVDGAVDIIYNTLRDAGLDWDEGPDIGGEYGPYVQSERMASYIVYAKQLIEKGEAYYCFCTKEELERRIGNDEANGGVSRYDGLCRELAPEEIKRRLAAGDPYIIRQKMPKSGTTRFVDLVYGEIEVDNAELEDQILIKSDGMPTYNFANVIDDHAMEITHVVRGNEYLSSAPKYNLLYEAFGWEVPQYIHCAPVMKNEHEKLSKRNGDASYQDLVAKGYLPAAIINYLALLGWSPKGEQEIFSLSDLAREFSVDGISKSPAIFDGEKLKYINGEYIRALSPEEYKEYALPYIKQAVKSDIDVDTLCAAMQPRTETFADIPEKLGFIDTQPEFSSELYFNKKMKTDVDTARPALEAALPVLESLESWTQESIHESLFALIEKMEVKNGWLLWPLRVALSGVAVSPGGGVELAKILGRDESIARIKKALARL